MSGRAWYYTLDPNGVPVECHDVMEWARWFETADRTVARTHITPEIEVSTVFLGLDHGHGMTPELILYETMVFVDTGNRRRYFGHGPERPVYDDSLEQMQRYSSRAQALLGHARIVKQVRARLRHIDKLGAQMKVVE